MALLMRKSDRIEIKIEDLVLKIAPLSFSAKMEINEVLSGTKNDDLHASMKAAKLAMMHSIKEIKGIECFDGEEYSLEFDGDKLSEECIDDLLNLEACPKLMGVCSSLLAGVSEKIVDPVTGEEMEGVEVMLGKKIAKKK